MTGESGQEDRAAGNIPGAGTEETETDGSRAGAGTKSGDVEMSDFFRRDGIRGKPSHERPADH